MNKNYTQKLADAQNRRQLRVIYISSYIPRECGIATFTKDLTNSINVLNPHFLAELVVVDPPDKKYDYPWEVKFRFSQEEWESYKAAADYINQSSADLVCLQHEYGLFGEKRGAMIVPLLRMIKKPIVTTLHTVLPIEKEEFPEIIQDISDLSEAVVVMIQATADRLITKYHVSDSKVVVIPHGVPDVAYLNCPKWRGRFKLRNKTVISTFGLINQHKGIEYMIRAMPQIIKKVPDAMYIVLGQTHPVVVRYDGEKYRRYLTGLVKELNIQNHVRFENRFLTLEELVMYLQTSDIYITPYLYPEQVSSGTLSYAVGAGLPCISTPYTYAKEVLSEGRGVVINYRNPKEIADTVIKLAHNVEYKNKIKQSAYAYGRKMTWDSVALKYLDLFSSVINEVKSTAKNK